jgi:hypothetical protein
MGGGNPNPSVATRFKPGAEWRGVPNPGGKPRPEPITSRIKALLELKDINGTPIRDGKQVADLVAEALVRGAIKGNPRILSMLLDRVEGKVLERLLVSSQGTGGPDISVVLAMVREAVEGEEADVQARVLARLAASARRIGLQEPAAIDAGVIDVTPVKDGTEGKDATE